MTLTDVPPPAPAPCDPFANPELDMPGFVAQTKWSVKLCRELLAANQPEDWR